MKKGTKAAIVAAVCCIVAGGALMGAGAMAGGIEQLESGEFDYIHLEDETAGWLGSFFLRGIRSGRNGAGSYDGEAQEEGVEVLSGDFDREIAYSGGLKRLKTNVGVHILRIEQNDTGKVTIEGKNCDRIQCYAKDGTLYVKDVGKKKKYTRINDRELLLTVPEDISWEEVEMEASIGGVVIEKLKADSAELNASMGNIEVYGLEAERLQIDTEMGNVTVSGAKTGSLEAEAEMGNIEFSGRVEKNITASAEMGSIMLALEQEKTEFDYEISADMGSVTLNGEEYSGLSGGWRENNGAGRRLEANSSMGSIDISFKQR